MPTHYGMNKKMDKPNKPKMEKPKKGQLTKKQMDKLKEHSKMHKGGFRSKHMKDMVKFMKEGDSFTKAHNKAVKLFLDKKK
tara:strand:+ start:211 stop:453 length:243 start_codon:yes stop_codon:yes gene_type:complete